jgi:hypothetical protein
MAQRVFLIIVVLSLLPCSALSDDSCPIEGATCWFVDVDASGQVAMDGMPMSLEDLTAALRQNPGDANIVIRTELSGLSCKVSKVREYLASHDLWVATIVPATHVGNGKGSGWTLYPPGTKCVDD